MLKIDMYIEDERTICLKAIETEEKQCDLGLIRLDQMSFVPYEKIQGDTTGLKVGMREGMTS